VQGAPAAPVPPWLPGTGLVACVLLGVMSHPSGALTPLYLVLWIALTTPGGVRAQATAAVRALARPPVLLAFAVVAGYLLWSSGNADNYRSLREPGAIAANAARALLALWPSELREWLVAGLRGLHGTAGTVIGAVGALLIALATLALFVRGGAVWRFALLAGALDMGLAIVTAGYSQRYAYFAAALVAIALADSWSRAPVPRRRVLAGAAVVLGACWLLESVRVVRELREAGTVVDNLLAQAVQAHAAWPAGRPFVVADLPDVWGREQDLPVFNWGFAPALRRCGVAQDVVQLRTTPARTSTAARLVQPAEVERLRREAAGSLLEYDARTRRLVWWRDGVLLPEAQWPGQ
jgi:hypothetical protein